VIWSEVYTVVENNGIINANLLEIEELEGKIAPDSGQWDPIGTL
jgi:hypothetical protein